MSDASSEVAAKVGQLCQVEWLNEFNEEENFTFRPTVALGDYMHGTYQKSDLHLKQCAPKRAPHSAPPRAPSYDGRRAQPTRAPCGRVLKPVRAAELTVAVHGVVRAVRYQVVTKSLSDPGFPAEMAAPLGSVWLADAQRFRTEDEQTEGTMPDSVFQLGWAAQVRLDPPRCPPDAYPSTDAVTFSVRRRSSRRARRSRATRRGLPHHSASTAATSPSSSTCATPRCCTRSRRACWRPAPRSSMRSSTTRWRARTPG